jgi:ABC-type transport system substrate-binding protein
MTRDEENNPITELADSYEESADKLTYTFKLRQGVKFHNGKPLTTDDALTDPDTIAQPKAKAWWGKAYSTLEAADHPAKKITPTPATRITPKQ